MAFCSFAVSALLRRATFLAGFFVLELLVATFAADFFLAFRAMEPAALSEGAELVCGLLPALAVCGQLIGDGLVLAEAAETGALNGTDVDEDVLGAVIRLNETVALGLVEPLYFTCSQNCSRFRV